MSQDKNSFPLFVAVNADDIRAKEVIRTVDDIFMATFSTDGDYKEVQAGRWILQRLFKGVKFLKCVTGPVDSPLAMDQALSKLITIIGQRIAVFASSADRFNYDLAMVMAMDLDTLKSARRTGNIIQGSDEAVVTSVTNSSSLTAW